MTVTPKQALEFVRKHGIVLMSARGPVPNLVEEIVGETIRGSWWSHPRSHEIYRLTTAVSGSRDVLVCKLVDGKVTVIHRRLWPAVARLSHRFSRSRIAAVREEHTSQGHHRIKTIPFARWLPKSVLNESKRLTSQAASVAIGEDLVRNLARKKKSAT